MLKTDGESSWAVLGNKINTKSHSLWFSMIWGPLIICEVVRHPSQVTDRMLSGFRDTVGRPLSHLALPVLLLPSPSCSEPFVPTDLVAFSIPGPSWSWMMGDPCPLHRPTHSSHLACVMLCVMHFLFSGRRCCELCFTDGESEARCVARSHTTCKGCKGQKEGFPSSRGHLALCLLPHHWSTPWSWRKEVLQP